MDSIDALLSLLQKLPPVGVLCAIFFVAYIENLFPPAPCDVLLIFAGTLVGAGTVGFVPAVTAATLGGTLGFMSAYGIGHYLDEHIKAGKFAKYLPVSAFEQVERLFQKYGYAVIVINRFLAGTRAVVSFFAGMSEMKLPLTTLLSAISAAVWNTLLIYFGMTFANNWRQVVSYLALYSKVATLIVLVALGFGVWLYFRRRRAARANSIQASTTSNQLE
jgi:membrane protein DedA with SNARE-associated domain